MPETLTRPEAVYLKAQRPGTGAARRKGVPQQGVVQGGRALWVRWRVRLHIFLLALGSYRSLAGALKATRALMLFKKNVYGKGDIKMVKVGRQYFFSIYMPGYPSVAFDDYLRSELNRFVPLPQGAGRYSFIHFAITSRCPLQCEHCFEWDNLNKAEAFTLEELKQVVAYYQQQGCAQFHLSGGEPLVRLADLEDLVATAGRQSEFWVLTSGLNLTRENARHLKQVGATGVVVSLDHFDAGAHNTFRGTNHAHLWALEAIYHAREAGLAVAVSVCATRDFTTPENLLHYAEYVQTLGVSFIQVLEPKAVGHYRGKKVALDWQQLQALEDFYLIMNFDPRYRSFPVVLYHGYHQRRIGCLMADDRSVYIDAAGFVNACPFCHTHSYRVLDRIANKDGNGVVVPMCCPDYGSYHPEGGV